MKSNNQAIHYLNGKFVTEKDFFISPRDVGFSRGYACFDFLVTYTHHRPFMLDAHVERLLNSTKQIRLKIPWTKKQIIDWVLETLSKNKTPYEKSIKIIVSGGLSNTMLPSDTPTLIIQIDPKPVYPEEVYTKGIGITTVKFTRYVPTAKTNNYIEGMKQTQLAKKIKAMEPVYYDDKQVFEGSNSNIFAVIKGELQTPKSNILPGITRGVLLKMLKVDIPVLEKDFSHKELLKASEVFMTSSTREVAPVTKIDGKKVGNGKVGEITKQAMREFHDYVLSNNW